MGDRCGVEVLCHENDIKRFEDIGFVKVSWGERSDNLCRMFEEEANYGAESELQTLADNGVVFFGVSGAGDEYPAAVFASDGKRFVSVNSAADAIEAKPVAEIDLNGNADLGTLKAIKRYYRTLKAAKKKLGIS